MSRLAIFGATGGTGLELIKQSLDAGHQVTAFARSPEKISDFGDQINIIEGDLSDISAIQKAVSGQDLVISALGNFNRKYNTMLSDGTRDIVDAMHTAGVKRFLVVTSLGCRESVSLIRSFIFRELVVKRFARQIWADKDRQEDIIEASGLDYTIVRPGGLTNNPATGNYQALEQHEQLPKKIMIPRGDAAHFIINAIDEDQTIGKIYSLVS